MNLLIIIIIIVSILLLYCYAGTSYESMTQTSCSTCPISGITCKDTSNQTFYNDPGCLNPDSDPFQGLGCIGTTGCRYCGFGSYSKIKCPISPPSPPSPPSPSPPTPSPPRSGKYKVNLVNQCPVDVLTAALGPTVVNPLENKSWVLKPGENLSIEIPNEWENTAGNSTVNGPRFWARTGCAYDINSDRASCEAGDCGGKYNCSAANMGGSPPGSWAEFCFNCGRGLTYYDVSLVDGSHMSMDIKPSNPGIGSDPFWCKTNLCNNRQDLRDPSICPADFQLINTQLKNHNPNTDESITACFSNCGKWAYEKGLLGNERCDPNNPNSDPRIENICKNWRKYCCQSPSSGKTCSSDSDCQFGEACWNGKCQCRPYYKKQCDPNVCTHPYCECHAGNCDPSVCPQGFATQPQAQICTAAEGCVGDDVFHQVCPQAYTWPNDPQTYNCDSKEYTVTFCPGGTPIKMADSIAEIPNCSTLNQAEYGYEKALLDCGVSIKKGDVYACARKTGNWACGIGTDASCYNLGVLCKFDK